MGVCIPAISKSIKPEDNYRQGKKVTYIKVYMKHFKIPTPPSFFFFDILCQQSVVEELKRNITSVLRYFLSSHTCLSVCVRATLTGAYLCGDLLNMRVAIVCQGQSWLSKSGCCLFIVRMPFP